jgi:hypothetical protein
LNRRASVKTLLHRKLTVSLTKGIRPPHLDLMPQHARRRSAQW